MIFCIVNHILKLPLLQKFLIGMRRDPTDLKIDINKVVDLFEKNVNVEPLVSIQACGVLSDII